MLLNRLMSVLWAVLALVCIAAVALRLRASFALDTIEWKRANTPADSVQMLQVANGAGTIRVFWYEVRLEPPAGPVPLGPWEVTWSKGPPGPLPQPPFLHGAHTSFATVPMPAPYGTVRQRDRDAFAVVPHWALITATGLPPALWWGPWWLRRRVRRRKGLCLHCGYDVRASPEKCPECGTPVRRPLAPAPPGQTEVTRTVSP